MLEEYNTIIREGQAEIVEKKSRFIATVRPAETEEDARAFIEETKKKYWDARHHVFAYHVGLTQEMQRQSDDGEPSGTAGLPVLQAIGGLDLKNTVVVVTRYFGGTLLGTGGLVRAYGKAAKEGLLAAGVAKRILYREFIVTVDYTLSGKIRYELEEGAFRIKNTAYTDQVAFTVLVEFARGDAFQLKMVEAASGKIAMEEREPYYGTVLDGELVL